MEPFAVTNHRFAAFVADTGYVSEAEREGWSFVFAGRLAGRASAHAGAGERAVVAGGAGRVWSAPDGPGSAARPDHPVVHVSLGRRAGVLRVGRRAAAERGGVGRGRARRRGHAVPVGRRVGPRARQRVPRRLPARHGRHRPGRRVRPQPGGAAQRRRQRLGVDGGGRAVRRLVPLPPVLLPPQPALRPQHRRRPDGPRRLPRPKGLALCLRHGATGTRRQRPEASRASRSGRG